MMTNKILIIGFATCNIVLSNGHCSSGFAQTSGTGIGMTAGFGLPKIPISRFRSPISIVGTGFLNYRPVQKVFLQVTGGALYTFSLGTMDSREGELKFNLIWGSLDAAYHLRGAIRNESFFLMGVGRYHLSQKFDEKETALNTIGINLGLVNWMHRGRFSAVIDIRWHLLFKPSPNPQVATLTLGIIL